MEKRIPGYCALCISRCGCISTVRDGELVSVEPDPAHPTGEHLCIKGRTAPEWVNSSERLLTPLKRTQPKGAADPDWQPISWDEALESIATRLQQLAEADGPESVVFSVTTPSGTAIADSFNWINRLAHAFGSPNTVFATENCNWHKDFTPMHTWGGGIGMPDYAQTGCILLWGFNPTTSWLAQAHLVNKAKRRGAKLVVIDCRKAGLASTADQWLAVRPGADGPLAMSLAHVLIEKGWYDQAFVRHWSNGPFLLREDTGQLLTEADIRPDGSDQQYMVWDTRGNGLLEASDPAHSENSDTVALFGRYPVDTLQGEVICLPVFQQYADCCREYAPEATEAVTGIDPEQLYQTAHLLHEHSPVSYFTWTGTAQQPEASQTSRAISLLYALTGDFDAPGGNVYFTKPALANFFGLDLLKPKQREKTLGLGERPVGPGRMGWITSTDLYRAVVEKEPYPVKALVSFGGNPQLTKPPTTDSKAALQQLDFYVHADLFMNPTAAYADIILPVASPWERSGLYPGFQVSQQAESHIQWRPAVIPPRGESKSDRWIVFQLAVRLGLGKHFFEGDRRRAMEQLLAPSGVDMDRLQRHPEGVDMALETTYRKYRQHGFATPSGRLEFFSAKLQEAGYDPLPQFAGLDRVTLNDAYPLRLTSAKWIQYCHSQQRQVPSLRRRMPDPLVEIHPDTAGANQIADGDWVEITTDQGAICARAKYNNSLAADVVCAQYGWWSQNEKGEGQHYNGLIAADIIDPVSGSNSLRSAFCRIKSGC